jgi:hypothetical protein
MKIIVPSCWAYRDSWLPFWRCFREFWPNFEKADGPFLITDIFSTSWGWEGERIAVGSDLGFTKNMLKALDSIPDDLYLMILDDHFLQDIPDFGYIERAKSSMISNPDIGCWRLVPCPGADTDIPHNSDTGIISKGTMYRVSCSSAIWKSSVLRNLLSRTKDGWDFELSGSPMSSEFPETFYSVRRERKPWPLQCFLTGISRGKWDRTAVDFLRKRNIPVDLSLRPFVD